MASWDIIFWDAGNCVDYVPSSWANPSKNQYKWPTDAKGIKGLIDVCTSLDQNFEWCDATFKKTCFSLKDAKHYSRKGEEMSSLETDLENMFQGETISKKKKKYCRDSTDSSLNSNNWKKPKIVDGKE